VDVIWSLTKETTLTNEQAADAKVLLGNYLVEGDIRYKRTLESLTNNQMRHTCGAFVQAMAFGSERNGKEHNPAIGGFPASCVRQAILAGLAEGNGFQTGDAEEVK
jgi:hypothetical protein